MSDFGDDMRDWRRRRQDYRLKHASECVSINCTTKVYDTEKTCRTCGRENPSFKAKPEKENQIPSDKKRGRER